MEYNLENYMKYPIEYFMEYSMEYPMEYSMSEVANIESMESSKLGTTIESFP